MFNRRGDARVLSLLFSLNYQSTAARLNQELWKILIQEIHSQRARMLEVAEVIVSLTYEITMRIWLSVFKDMTQMQCLVMMWYAFFPFQHIPQIYCG
jgi:hypothetical protein